MPLYRFFIDAKLTGQLSFEGVEQRHMTQVVRVKAGQEVELFNGRGDLASAKILSLDKKEVKVEVIESHHYSQTETLILAQALPLINRLDFILEKCTELGIAELRLFAGDLSERKSLTEHQIERLHHLTIAACKQSGRLWLPKVNWVEPIRNWKGPIERGIFGEPSPSAESLLKSKERPKLVCIGPESGLSRDEKKYLIKLGLTPCVWNEAVLRTDTAAISAAAIINAM